MATVETPAAAGVSIFAPFLRAGFQTGVGFTMKTKWGSCNYRRAHIRLNTELVRKPRDLLEYVIVHEMIHLIEPTHNERFIALLDQFHPTWREARAELNALPLGQAA
ncbi:MAG: M48 family metallopeptidase [Zoogloeaceae bacterium]|jgi:predicted metal-dependent hydrolase|nr:M48 family metallopeptidase [Zoogloeaceae bacterium]